MANDVANEKCSHDPGDAIDGVRSLPPINSDNSTRNQNKFKKIQIFPAENRKSIKNTPTNQPI
jgi:hypothetical protein